MNKENAKLEQFKKYISDKSISVVGIGVSNLPLVKFLAKYCTNIKARDKKTVQQLGESYTQLKNLGVEFIFGEDYLNELNEDIIFKTPGMRLDTPELVEAEKRGSIITSEMEAFLVLCPATVIGITGSDGKTTTTTIIYKMLQKQGYSCLVGGNIGVPLLSKIEEISKTDKVIVELSSFQLQNIKSSPHISVVTNVTPNHLDIHNSMEEYITSKKNIFMYQNPDDRLIINLDNDVTKTFAGEAVSCVCGFSSRKQSDAFVYCDGGCIYVNDEEEDTVPVLNTNDILIPGAHNVQNYMAAIAAVWSMCSVETINDVAASFSGVEHRIEFVREYCGVKYYNDSIASSPARTNAAFNSFNQKLILIAGGYDKNISFDEFGFDVMKHVKSLILMGKTADKIEKAVIAAGGKKKPQIPITRCDNITDAVLCASKAAESGDVVILSPACASFDMFKNFEERGRKFKDAVSHL